MLSKLLCFSGKACDDYWERIEQNKPVLPHREKLKFLQQLPPTTDFLELTMKFPLTLP